jgi:hypothetical protein
VAEASIDRPRIGAVAVAVADKEAQAEFGADPAGGGVDARDGLSQSGVWSVVGTVAPHRVS